MRKLRPMMTQPKIIFRLAVLCAALVTFWAMPLLSSAKSQSNSVTITNNSSREIRHVYFSPVDSDDWGPDQLSENAALHTGESATLNISSNQSQIKVIAEDKDGCFSYNTVSSSGNSAWSITDDTAPDCGN